MGVGLLQGYIRFLQLFHSIGCEGGAYVKDDAAKKP